MGLTPVALRNAAVRERPYKMYDRNGLYVIVSPAGSKLWRFDYRWQGRRKTLAFGQWPKVSVAQARDRRDAAREHLDAGRDPAGPEKPQTGVTPTFEVAGRAWFENRTSAWVSSYSTRILARLQDDIFPEIGAMQLDQIEPPVLLAAIRKIEDRGAIELAKRVKNYCGEIFRFGIAEGWCQRDPSADIRSALKPKPRTVHRAALRFSQMPEFITKLDAMEETLAVQALKLMLLTALRTHEIRFARWSEFDGGVWRVPAERMKERLEHIVPLPRQAQRLLERMPRRGPLLFVAPTRSGVISENAMLSVLFRLGYRSSATVHGFRRTFSTHANESGLWRDDAIEMALAHVVGSDVRRAYNAALLLDERARLLQWWADALWPDFKDVLG